LNTIRFDAGLETDYVNLWALGDLHVGSEHSQIKMIKEHIEQIKKDPNAYVILNGDLANTAVKYGVSDIYTEKLNPEQTIDLLVELFTPIKDKIIGLVPGNHENRVYKETGIHMLKNFAYRLGIMDYYDNIANVVFITFGKSRGRNKSRNTFSVYHTHGAGGGAKVGSKANKVENLSNVILTDVYIHSHTHQPIGFKQDYFIALNNNKGVKKLTSTFVNTSSYEEYDDFAKRMSMKPSTLAPVRIQLKTDYYGNKYTEVLL
jgi:predicted phosphodiesterase